MIKFVCLIALATVVSAQWPNWPGNPISPPETPNVDVPQWNPNPPQWNNPQLPEVRPPVNNWPNQPIAPPQPEVQPPQWNQPQVPSWPTPEQPPAWNQPRPQPPHNQWPSQPQQPPQNNWPNQPQQPPQNNWPNQPQQPDIRPPMRPTPEWNQPQQPNWPNRPQPQPEQEVGRPGVRDVRCPARNATFPTIFAHERHCNMFYMCNDGLRFTFECPDGLFFDRQRQICDRRQHVQC